MPRHNIPLGTHVSFGVEGHSVIYEVSDYQDVIGPCPPDCKWDHDHYLEPYIHVTKHTGTAFPLSKLETVFEGHVGRKPTAAELEIVDVQPRRTLDSVIEEWGA